MGLIDRFQHAWNAFMGRDPTRYRSDLGPSTYYRSGRGRFGFKHDRSMVTSAINRIAVDVASIDIEHVQLDDNNRYVDTFRSYLNDCLTVEANIDQTAFDFKLDMVYTLLDEGTVALFIVDATADPTQTQSYDIGSLRVARVVEWYPRHVKVNVYNDKTGKHQDVIVPKDSVALVQNPFYHIMNEPNSFYQKLLQKIRMLDVLDEQSSSGKLDLIIQLPYIIKSEARRQQAEQRRKDIEMQLAGSRYGIAYTDGTEKITQLNRSIENNLFTQVEYYTKQWLNQLGIPQTVFDGTADEKTMLNYQTRTLEPIISAIVDEMKRKFLTKTARTKGQSIMFFKDPFSLVPVNNIADIADKFTRNEILTSNEVRQIIGFKPAGDPRADELRNSNMPQEDLGMAPTEGEDIPPEEYPPEEAPPEEIPSEEEDPMNTPISELMQQ